MKRCAWSHEKSEDLQPVTVPATDRLGRPAGEVTLYVRPQHAEALQHYFRRAYRYGRLFLVGMLTLAAVALGGAVGAVLGLGTVARVLVGGATGGMGLLLLAFPFVTPETLQLLGVRRSMRVGRGSGLLLLAMGLAILLVGRAG